MSFWMSFFQAKDLLLGGLMVSNLVLISQPKIICISLVFPQQEVWRVKVVSYGKLALYLLQTAASRREPPTGQTLRDIGFIPGGRYTP